MEKNIFNVNDYFSLNYGLGRKPKMPTFNKKLIIIGILFLLGGLALGIWVEGPLFVLMLVGIIVLAGPAIKFSMAKAKAVAWQNNYNQRRNTWDAELDNLYKATVNDMNLDEVSMEKIGVVPEQLSGVDPFYITGNLYDECWRKGVDGKFRTSKCQISRLLFSGDQIFLYKVTFSLLNNKKIVNTFELFYKDIVSISVTTETQNLSGDKTGDEGTEVIENQQFTLVVPGDKMHFAFTSSSEINESIQGMKTRIREKKNAEEKNAQEVQAA